MPDIAPHGVVARGRFLNDVALECLEAIENELDGHAGAVKLKSFIALTRQGRKAIEASRILDITPEYPSCREARHEAALIVNLLSRGIGCRNYHSTRGEADKSDTRSSEYEI